ncbi:MAG: NlpC/P60 family protein, partial [Actinobacteria bacterium]|nr:NlpC/P60 family protein [Actinomycetota bacterium]
QPLAAGVAAAEPVAPGDMEGTVPPEATSTTSTVPAGKTVSPSTPPTSVAPAKTTTAVPSGPSPEALRRLRELEALSGTISQKQMQVFRAAIELDDIDRDLEATVEEYNLRVLELEEARQRAARLQRELDLTQQEAQAATEALQNRLLGAYKSDTSVLEVLLATTDMADFIRRLGLILSIAQSDRRRLDEVVSLRARSERLLDELSRLIYDVTTASRRLEAQKSLVEAKLAAKQAYIDGLSAEIKVLVERQRQIAGAVVPSGVEIGSYMIGDANQIVKTALRYLGVPYLWGGATPGGFDCSGLVQYVFMQHGLYLPHYSGYQALAGFEVSLRDIQPADLVFFGDPVHHVGIYIGDDLFIHAPSTGDVVKISRLSERRDLSHIRRVTFRLPAGGVPAR